ncbi:MAG: MFS transporter [Clostridiales bacterium]|nr:MFS transporter [Clostridiales bacterium]
MNKEVRETNPLRFAAGMFGGVLTASYFTTFMAFFYVDKMSLDVKIYSAALALYSVLDAVDNPMYGYLSDRTRTRFGRRKPWLVLGILLCTVGVIAFFSPPSGLEGAMFVTYFIVTMLLTETAISMIQANYGSLFPELFRTKQSRALANALRQGLQFAATIIAVGLTPMLNERFGYSATAVFLALTGGAIYLFSALGCHEDQTLTETEKPALFKSVKELLASRNFWIVGITGTMYSTAIALIMAGVPFYIKYSLNAGGAGNSLLIGAVLVAATGSLAAWNFALKKFSLVTVWRASLAVLALALIPFYAANSLTLAVITGVFVGIGMGGYVSTGDLVTAYLIDEDMAKHGVRREGMFISILAFINRISGFIRSLVFLLLAALYGFESGEAPGPNPGAAAKFLLIAAPFVLVAAGFICSMFMFLKDPIKKEGDNINE